MKTTRTRILMVVIAASVVVMTFMNWSEVERGARDGWNAYGESPRTPTMTERALIEHTTKAAIVGGSGTLVDVPLPARYVCFVEDGTVYSG